MRLTQVGSFLTTSDRLRISDPCYDKNVECTGIVFPTIRGEWEAFTAKESIEGWGDRNTLLLVKAKNAVAVGDWKLLDMDIGVDAGMAGIFDESKYQTEFTTPVSLSGELEYERKGWKYQLERSREHLKSAKNTRMELHFQNQIEEYELDIASYDTKAASSTKDFYKACCSIAKGDVGAGTIPYGAVSSSGFGDGSYVVYGRKTSQGEVAEIKIVFIDENEFNDYEEFDLADQAHEESDGTFFLGGKL